MSHSLQQDLLRPSSSSSPSLTQSQDEVPLFSGIGDSFASLLNSVGLSNTTAAMVNQISGFISSIPEPTNPQPSEYYQALPSGAPIVTNSISSSIPTSSSGTRIPYPLPYQTEHNNSKLPSEASIRAELENSKMEIASLRFELLELKTQMKHFEADLKRVLKLQGLEIREQQISEELEKQEKTTHI